MLALKTISIGEFDNSGMTSGGSLNIHVSLFLCSKQGFVSGSVYEADCVGLYIFVGDSGRSVLRQSSRINR